MESYLSLIEKELFGSPKENWEYLQKLKEEASNYRASQNSLKILYESIDNDSKNIKIDFIKIAIKTLIKQ